MKIHWALSGSQRRRLGGPRCQCFQSFRTVSNCRHPKFFERSYRIVGDQNKLLAPKVEFMSIRTNCWCRSVNCWRSKLIFAAKIETLRSKRIFATKNQIVGDQNRVFRDQNEFYDLFGAPPPQKYIFGRCTCEASCIQRPKAYTFSPRPEMKSDILIPDKIGPGKY